VSDGELDAAGETGVTIGPACYSVLFDGDGSIEVEDDWGLFVAVESMVEGRVTWIQSRGSEPTLEATSTHLPGTWLHVAMTFDWDSGTGTGEAALYVDGVPSGSATLPSPSASADAALSLGRDGAFDSHSLQGRLDDVHISRVVRYDGLFLTSAAAVADDDTIALWRLEEGTGAVAADSGATGFHGTIVNGEWSDLSACGEGR
jgi:hypothetical protein